MISTPEARGLAVAAPTDTRLTWFGAYCGLITLVFAKPLVSLCVLALRNDLHSYIPAIPFVSAYVLWLKPRSVRPYTRSLRSTAAFALVAVAAAAVGIAFHGLSASDARSLMVLAYLLFVVAGGCWFLGAQAMRAAAFPLAFLVFMIPLPDGVVSALEQGLVTASADVAELFFRLTGTPVFRQANTLTLPGMVLEVARECSGIRSTLVLFITSVLVSYLFLQSSWRRLVLVAVVIPLGILRNAFRILVVGLLCVHIGPEMSESFIHRRGGPIFFVLALIPLLAFLGWLRRGD
jgi:exosortase C (VPDSG-CTERM-specific)